MVGVAAIVEKSNGNIDSARIGLTSMGSTPIRATAVEEALSGASPDEVAEVANSADEGTSPASDDAASEPSSAAIWRGCGPAGRSRRLMGR